MLRSRRRGQAIVEFGLISLLFVGLLFAVVDFGLLLNTWLAVSSGSREIARSAQVGKDWDFLEDQAMRLRLPSVSVQGFTGGMCCGPTSAVELTVTYFDCDPLPCAAVEPGLIRPAYDPSSKCSGTCPNPAPGDYVQVVLQAHGAQVITPLIRPFFGCTNGNNPNCNVTLTSTTMSRFEGVDF
jgi:hypothetical protein